MRCHTCHSLSRQARTGRNALVVCLNAVHFREGARRTPMLGAAWFFGFARRAASRGL